MRRALTDTALVWIVVALALAVQALQALGVPVPLVERSGVWRLTTQPWAIATLAAMGAATVGLLRYGPGPDVRRARMIGWTLGVLSLACLVAFGPGVAVVIAATGRMVFTGGTTARPLPPGPATRLSTNPD